MPDLRGKPKTLVNFRDHRLIACIRVRLTLADYHLKMAKRDGSYWLPLCEVEIGGARRKVPLCMLVWPVGFVAFAWTEAPLIKAKSDIAMAMKTLLEKWQKDRSLEASQ